MRTLPSVILALGLVGGFAACGGDDESAATTTTPAPTTTNTGSGGSGASGGSGGTTTTTTTTTTTNTGTGGNTGGSGTGGNVSTPSMDWIGGDCTCTGNECAQQGVPKPAGGTIVGCDDMPTPWAEASPVCLRTYEGALAKNTYFANGYCSLMATACTGASLICDSAVWGNYDGMTTCPAGSVLLDFTQDVTVIGFNATISSKLCARSCAATGDCRESETDPVLNNAATQYSCIDHSGVKFCYDTRNLPDTYSATAF